MSVTLLQEMACDRPVVTKPLHGPKASLLRTDKENMEYKFMGII